MTSRLENTCSDLVTKINQENATRPNFYSLQIQALFQFMSPRWGLWPKCISSLETSIDIFWGSKIQLIENRFRSRFLREKERIGVCLTFLSMFKHQYSSRRNIISYIYLPRFKESRIDESVFSPFYEREKERIDSFYWFLCPKTIHCAPLPPSGGKKTAFAQDIFFPPSLGLV